MPLSLPLLSQIAAGTFIFSAPIKNSFQAIIDKFNGQIVDADIHATANVSGAKVADRSIAGAKLTLSAVSVLEIADAAVTTPKILDANVTTAKILDANVTKAKIAASAITSDKINKIIVTATFSYVSAAGGELLTGSLTGFGAYTVALYDAVGPYVRNLRRNGGAAGASAAYVILDDSGANWAATALVRAAVGLAGTYTGTVVVFMVPKT